MNSFLKRFSSLRWKLVFSYVIVTLLSILILEGIIIKIRDETGAYNINEQVKDIKIYITVDIKFRDVKKRKIIWEEQITQWGTYEPGGTNNRNDGIEEAIDKLVADILNKTIAGW